MQTMGRNQNGLRSRVLFVRYEDLVGDTESEARRLSKFCGLAFHPAALAKRNADARGTRSIIHHQHWGAYLTALSVGPVSRTSVRRTRDGLEPARAQPRTGLGSGKSMEVNAHLCGRRTRQKKNYHSCQTT